jgi:hypothetical protein
MQVVKDHSSLKLCMDAISRDFNYGHYEDYVLRLNDNSSKVKVLDEATYNLSRTLFNIFFKHHMPAIEPIDTDPDAAIAKDIMDVFKNQNNDLLEAILKGKGFHEYKEGCAHMVTFSVDYFDLVQLVMQMLSKEFNIKRNGGHNNKTVGVINELFC